MRDYAAITTLVTTKLQSAGTSDYTVAEVDYGIEEGLKEFSSYRKHIVPIIFKIESRYGDDATGTAGSLTDTVKDQFVATDDDNEKVVHNITDNTWAIVKTYTDATVLVLNADIMDANEHYEIYNKKCWNNKQIYIGDVLPLITDIESVEYPLGTRRNWKIVSEGVLEIGIDSVPDSNANTAVVSSLPNVDVLVRFNRPHVLPNLTDWVGAVAGTAGVAAATTLDVKSFAASVSIEEGSEFSIATHRQSYIITANTTAAGTAAVAIGFYPPLEAVCASTAVVTFTKSTLNPSDEEIFSDLVASRLAINKAPKYFNAISLGGGVVYQHFLDWGEKRLAETLGKLRRETPPRTNQTYARD